MERVCHITTVHNWNDTRIFYKECISLAKNGYTVSLIAPNADNQILENIHIYGVKNNSRSRLFRATFLAFKVLIKALKTKSKIYHFHDPELIWVGFFLKCLGKKVIYDVHENVRAQIIHKDWLIFPKLVSSIYGIFERLAAKMFYMVIAEESYKDIFHYKTKSITKVFNYPLVQDLKVFRKNFDQRSENGVLYVGLVSESRGIIEIIKALAILKKKKIAFKFHCVGPISENFKDKILNLEDFILIKDSVIFYDRLPLFEAYKYSEISKVALSVLHPLPNYISSYSTKIFEYMAIGVPFIVSDFAIYEFVKKESIGFVVNPLNYVEISELLEKILLNDGPFQEMVETGYKAVEQKYSWESQAKNLLDLYKTISN
jgi:glycosyltransferase involved in cell wall biosynthesis